MGSWETLVAAREGHAPALKDLSLEKVARDYQKQPTTRASKDGTKGGSVGAMAPTQFQKRKKKNR